MSSSTGMSGAIKCQQSIADGFNSIMTILLIHRTILYGFVTANDIFHIPNAASGFLTLCYIFLDFTSIAFHIILLSAAGESSSPHNGKTDNTRKYLLFPKAFLVYRTQSNDKNLNQPN